MLQFRARTQCAVHRVTVFQPKHQESSSNFRSLLRPLGKIHLCMWTERVSHYVRWVTIIAGSLSGSRQENTVVTMLFNSPLCVRTVCVVKVYINHAVYCRWNLLLMSQLIKAAVIVLLFWRADVLTAVAFSTHSENELYRLLFIHYLCLLLL